jgi:hypothetical protein
MGYWYLRNLWNAEAQDEATTNRLDLPEKGYLSGLKITVSQLNTSDLDNAVDNPYPVQRINPTIMANGNVPLINLRGRQLEALNFWETGHMSRKLLWTLRGINLSEEIFIPFGRYLGDLKYGLILENFKSGVQFEDTNTWDTTYVTAGHQTYTIDALFRKNPETDLFSGGFLKKLQVADETCATRVQHGVKLPTDELLKQIYVFTEPTISSHLPATTPFSNLTTLWLSILAKQEYLINGMSAGALAYYMHQLYGRVARTEGLTGDTASTHYCDTKIYERQGTGMAMFNTTAGFLVEDAATNLERILKMYSKNTSGNAAGQQAYWNAQGICPHGLIPLLLQDPMSDESAWLDSKAQGDVYVDGTEGGASGHWYIVLDELQKAYPA